MLVKDVQRVQDELLSPTYGSRDFKTPVAKNSLPQKEMAAQHAYDLIHDLLMLDGNSRLNLATFVSTWMEPEAARLMAETLDKNMIDKDEYPQTAEIEKRCVSMLAKLWHCQQAESTLGCSTTGSSEAAMLAGLALKWAWRKRREEQGLSTAKPNLVMGINVQVCWEKFCRYWDIEMRQAPMKPGKYTLQADEAEALCDENTIGVIAILGSTFTGEYEPIEAIHRKIAALNKRTGWQIPLHIDAASGGFIAPFLQPKLKWDFRLPWVKSINASGHKYGLVYPGVGWVVWRDKEELPQELIFDVNYLGGTMPTFALNFSRPGSQVIAQYYNFLRLGFEGYQRIHSLSQQVAQMLASGIKALDIFEIIADGRDIPVVCWKMKKPMNFNLYDFSERLRVNGWLVPAYSLPNDCQDTVVMRVVVKEGFSLEMVNLLLNNMREALSYFAKQKDYQSLQPAKGESSGFRH